jgi:hypothetical protein
MMGKLFAAAAERGRRWLSHFAVMQQHFPP